MRRLFWKRLREDRGALLAAGAVAFILFALFAGPPIAEAGLGHGPNDLFPYAVNGNLKPVGPWTKVPDVHVARADPTTDVTLPAEAGTPSTLLVFGADGGLGRDEFLRLLVGGRNSLTVALLATMLSMTLGLLIGGIAGYFGGWVDGGVSRLTEFVMAFPLLLFVIMIGSTAADRIDDVTVGGFLDRGMLSLVLIIGLFTWFYPARIVRARILTLKESEFVDAAETAGAGDWWIMHKHLFPHLAGPLVAVASIALATNILLEAGITFLGVGIKIPATSWGTMLVATWGSPISPGSFNPQLTSVWVTIFPSVAILITVLAFNYFGEGVRAALDPAGARA